LPLLQKPYGEGGGGANSLCSLPQKPPMFSPQFQVVVINSVRFIGILCADFTRLERQIILPPGFQIQEYLNKKNVLLLLPPIVLSVCE